MKAGIVIGLLSLLLLAACGTESNEPTPNSKKGISGGQADSDDCLCAAIYEPVCGNDEVTYPNACSAGCADVAVAKTGVC